MAVVAEEELPPRVIDHVFTSEERGHQLGVLARLCDRLADVLSEHGEGTAADQYRARAQAARHLLATGFTRQDLIDVASRFPSGPGWLHPKAFGFHVRRARWQDEVEGLAAQASSMATDIRAVATLREL